MPTQSDLEFQKFDPEGRIKVNEDLIPVLKAILQAIANPSYVDKSANQARSQITGTLTTVTTVTGITNLGSFSADVLLRNNNVNAWANSCRALIT